MPAPATWLHHLEDEADAAFLYRELARAERDPEKAGLYRRLAEVEDRHVEMWRRVLAENGHPAEIPTPSRGARLRAWLARRLGSGILLPMLLEEEGREVKGYLNLYRAAPEDVVAPTALRLAKESKEHAETLARMSGGGGEPWHKTGAGGFLRNVVYGFNDGLTANFGLLAGMIGAQSSLETASHIVVVAGLAGTVADALSMGASGYLAAKSEREVFEHEIAMEKEEIRLMPELEQEELSLLYQAKGIPADQADALATQVMSDPVRALEEKVREELKIGEATTTPMREAWITGTATALGAFIPVAPLLVSTQAWAIWTSFTLAMVSHFAVGA
ncbi:MAG: VIT1/CCC1 transporter family protein, partial [Gemmatimonadales bacterium]